VTKRARASGLPAYAGGIALSATCRPRALKTTRSASTELWGSCANYRRSAGGRSRSSPLDAAPELPALHRAHPLADGTTTKRPAGVPRGSSARIGRDASTERPTTTDWSSRARVTPLGSVATTGATAGSGRAAWARRSSTANVTAHPALAGLAPGSRAAAAGRSAHAGTRTVTTRLAIGRRRVLKRRIRIARQGRRLNESNDQTDAGCVSHGKLPPRVINPASCRCNTLTRRIHRGTLCLVRSPSPVVEPRSHRFRKNSKRSYSPPPRS
jgi:hypothetical protein